MNTARRQRRRWPWALAGALVAAAAISAVLFVAVRPLVLHLAKDAVDEKLKEVSEAIGRRVTAGGLSSGLTEHIELTGIEVSSRDGAEATVKVAGVRLDFTLWDAIMGRRMPRRVEVDGLFARVRLKGGVPADLMDLSRGLAKWRRGGARREAGDRGGAIGPWSVTASGVIEVVAEDRKKGRARATITAHATGDSGGRVGVGFSGKLDGLGPKAAAMEGEARFGAGKGAKLSVRFDRQIEPSRILDDALGVPLLLSGIVVEAPPGHGEIVLAATNVELQEPVEIPRTDSIGRFVSGFGGVSAGQARVEIRPGGGPDLMKRIGSLSVVNGSARVSVAKPRLGDVYVSGMDARASRDPETGEVAVVASGEMRLGHEEPARGELKARVGDDGVLRELNLSLSGEALASLASRVHHRLLPWPSAAIGLKAVVKGDGRRYGVVGRAWGSGLTYFWTKLCLVPITGIDLSLDFNAMLDLPQEHLHLEVGPVAVGQARFSFDVDVSRLFGKPRIKAGFTIPKQRCEDVAAAVPRVMVPRLDGARFDGWMSLHVTADVDYRKIDKARLRVTADVDECRALSLGPLVDVDRLNSRWFVHEVREEDFDKPIRLGPPTESWTPIEEIPIHVQQAALATEDMLFFEHSGFQVGLMRRAMRLNLEHGWYVYGGSTISQQLVKNLFLSREKTLARKLEEAVIVWVMESRLEKERILELYLNCIEFGLHVYGIRAAAREYYDKEPSELTALDAAFIMATKPKPRYAHKVYMKRAFNDWWVKRMKGILERLNDPMGVVDYRTTVTPDRCPPGGPRGKYLVPCFHYADGDVYMQPAVSPDTEIPPGMPEEIPGAGGAVGTAPQDPAGPEPPIP